MDRIQTDVHCWIAVAAGVDAELLCLIATAERGEQTDSACGRLGVGAWGDCFPGQNCLRRFWGLVQGSVLWPGSGHQDCQECSGQFTAVPGVPTGWFCLALLIMLTCVHE